MKNTPFFSSMKDDLNFRRPSSSLGEADLESVTRDVKQPYLGLTLVLLEGSTPNFKDFIHLTERWAVSLGIAPERGRILHANGSASSLPFHDFYAAFPAGDDARSSGFWWGGSLQDDRTKATNVTDSYLFHVQTSYYAGQWIVHVSVQWHDLSMEMSDLRSWIHQAEPSILVDFGFVLMSKSSVESFHRGLEKVRTMKARCGCDGSLEGPDRKGACLASSGKPCQEELPPLLVLTARQRGQKICDVSLLDWLRRDPDSGSVVPVTHNLWMLVLSPQNQNTLRQAMRRQGCCGRVLFGSMPSWPKKNE